MPQVRVFHIAYDASLLRARTAMLDHAGFQVTSVLGNEQARRVLTEQTDFDLVLVGWSADNETRRDIVRWLKQHLPSLRVFSLHTARAQPLAEADFNSCSENPAEWFTAVKKAAVA